MSSLLFAFLSTSVLSQTLSERSDLADELNNAMDYLQVLIWAANNVPPIPVSYPFTLSSDVPVKSYDGTCTNTSDVQLVWLPHIVPNDESSPTGVRLEVLLNEEGEMDIPELSHELVCGLNTWLWHGFNGNLRQNWSLDEDNNVVIEDWSHFDLNCTTSSQKFWMVDGNGSVIDDRDGNLAALNITDDMWVPTREHSGPLNDNGNEVVGLIKDADLVQPNNGTNHVWIARRHDANDGRIEIKRAYSKVTFNNVYPGGTYQYYPTPYTKTLKSIELVARIHEYSPDDCPQGTGSIQPNSSKADVIMTITYEEGGTNYTISCTETWGTFGDEDGNNESLWNRMNGNYGRLWGEFDIDEDGMLYFETTTSCSGSPTPIRFGVVKLRSRTVPADQCEMTMGYDGTFNVDPMTGNLTYTYLLNGETITEQVFCFDFCETLSGTLAFDNVLSGFAQTFVDEWSYDPKAHGSWSDGHDGGARYAPGEVLDPYLGMPDNPFQRAERGEWRPDKSYVYRAAIKSAVGGEKVYDNAGLIVDANGNTTGAFDLFNWRTPDNNVESWVNPVTIVQYAPSGQSVEEHNLINIYSTAHLAHEETVPNLVALNAPYEAVDFESFEDRAWWGDWDANESEEWHPDIVETHAHSGERSYLLDMSGNFSSELASVTLTDSMNVHGLLLKFWLKQTYNVFDANPLFSDPPVSIKIGGLSFSNLAPSNSNTLDPDVIHKVAQTGEWSLYQVIVKDFSPEIVGATLPVIIRNNIPTQYEDSVWIDDVRMQPLEASMTCFVYDRNTLRLLAQFDDQHFGLYSRYNGEGSVVSILRETERGIVTVSESQDWIKTQPRHIGGGPPSSILSGGSNLSSSIKGMNVGPIGANTDYGTGFDIMNLQIGPNGPTAELFSGDKMPLDDLGDLLNFRNDFPDLSSAKLAELSPELSEIQRLRLVKELVELDRERQNIVEELSQLDKEDADKEMVKQLNTIDRRRDEILRDELGLTEEEIERLYSELESANRESEE